MITSKDLSSVPKTKQLRSVLPYLREKAEKQAEAEKKKSSKEVSNNDE